jgi:nitroreductase
MLRSFDGTPLDGVEVETLFCDALQVPSAGNSRGVGWIALVGPGEVATYFEAATDEAWRSSSTRAEGLGRASAIGICLADPQAYVDRYAAPDKQGAGLGTGTEAWPVPYWIGDAGASVLAALLLAEARGLGAAFLGAFRNDGAVRAAFAIPLRCVIYGAVLLGRPDGNDHRSPSLDRPAPSHRSQVRRRAWD